jgi:hypothetical protein
VEPAGDVLPPPDDPEDEDPEDDDEPEDDEPESPDGAELVVPDVDDVLAVFDGVFVEESRGTTRV